MDDRIDEDVENNEIIVKEETVKVPTLQFEVDKTKTFSEQAKDVVGAMATAKAIQDEKLVKNVTEAKKDELSSRAEAEAKSEKAKTKDAEKKLQESTFGIYEGVASYIGLKRPLPEKMLKILMFFIQPIVGLFITIIGFPISIIAICMDGINILAEKFADISESAKRIVKALWWIALVVIGILVINALLQRYLNFSLW